MEVKKQKTDTWGKHITIITTNDEYNLIRLASHQLKKKFHAVGGKEDEIMPDEALEWFFLGLMYREGKDAVEQFVNTWQPYK